ncbi:MAG: superoxide dismutase family protein [Cyclobacteriaceae bacterium]
MRQFFTVLAILIISLISSCEADESPAVDALAVATIYGLENASDSTFAISDSEVGAATFSQREDIVTVNINVTGLIPNNRHAIHIHMGSCEEPGMHWNQGTTASFCREPNLDPDDIWTKPYAGDVGNLRTNETGSGTLELSTKFWRLGSGDALDITGLTIIIHENEEDFAQECFQSHSHMHNNPKIACGTIDLISND